MPTLMASEHPDKTTDGLGSRESNLPFRERPRSGKLGAEGPSLAGVSRGNVKKLCRLRLRRPPQKQRSSYKQTLAGGARQP